MALLEFLRALGMAEKDVLHIRLHDKVVVEIEVDDFFGLRFHDPQNAREIPLFAVSKDIVRCAAQQLGSGSLCYKLARANGKTIFSALHPGDVISLEV